MNNNEIFLTTQSPAKSTSIANLERILYAIDNSGSTSGVVLQEEKYSAKIFFALLSAGRNNFEVHRWNSSCHQLDSLDDLKSSEGGTCPVTIVPALKSFTPQLLILYTDGECTKNDGDLLIAALREGNISMPIILVFSLKPSLQNPTTSISQLERDINMSIPNAFLTTSADVCIVINAKEHRTLMASGAFKDVFQTVSLQNSTTLRDLPLFNFRLLEKVNLVEQSSLPAGCIRLNGFPNPLILERLYNSANFEQVTSAVIIALSDRMQFPRLNLDRLHEMCVKYLAGNNYETDPTYKIALENLMRVAVNSNKSIYHFECRRRVEEIKASFKGAETAEKKAKKAAIHGLLQMIADYRANANQFVLGSNRANRAADISIKDEKEWRDMLVTPSPNILRVEECPIWMTPGNACILLSSALHLPSPANGSSTSSSLVPSGCKDNNSACSSNALPQKPDASQLTKINGELAQRFTSDFFINSPFHLGASQMIVTTKIFSADFGLDCAENPFSKQPICARIVLVKHIPTLMRQLCQAFCASRQMWHMVIAFASMLAKHLLEDEFAEHSIILPYFLWLIDAIRTTKDFSDDSLLAPDVAAANRVPLRQAIQFVMENYQVHLRNRLPSDSRAMFNIPITLAKLSDDNNNALPALQNRIAKMGGMLDVIETFSKLLDSYKKGTNPIDFIMERDAVFEHCVKPLQGLSAIIGMILFQDALQVGANRRGPKRFMNLALQDAIDLAITRAKESKDSTVTALYRAFTGENVDDVVPLTLPVVPKNSHFGQENFDREAMIDGLHYAVCGYCGFKRQVGTDWEHSTEQDRQARSDMREHFLRAFTPEFFFNGFRCVKEACQELGIATPEATLFISIKDRLYAKHGVDFWALHTEECKNQLLYFIRMRKWEAKLLAERPIKE